ncbi:hypothetical protein [Bifidobacterium sp. SO1]|uniref:hypothetical protein n=1 Tax=Bifidobacterium sp. SO1 TaxID=2809029 RepID=UPI001BDBF9A9|nr:hypothetical protein [Bifidobacterium sp. SO1]MBT1162222.1 hypothetical protein [Bifidobacterium sp. SO1]
MEEEENENGKPDRIVRLIRLAYAASDRDAASTYQRVLPGVLKAVLADRMILVQIDASHDDAVTVIWSAQSGNENLAIGPATVIPAYSLSDAGDLLAVILDGLDEWLVTGDTKYLRKLARA